jgi:hypothetical protein
MNYKIQYTGFRDDKEWPCFAWRVTIGAESFEYRTGIGHATPYAKGARIESLILDARNGVQSSRYGFSRNPKPDRETLPESSLQVWLHVPPMDEVLDCLFSDAEAGAESFDDFCSNFGYSSDSLKALDMYRACMETAKQLRRALGSEYETQRERIAKLRDEGKL